MQNPLLAMVAAYRNQAAYRYKNTSS